MVLFYTKPKPLSVPFGFDNYYGDQTRALKLLIWKKLILEIHLFVIVFVKMITALIVMKILDASYGCI